MTTAPSDGCHRDRVKLTAVELRRVALPLVAPFRTSFGVETDKDALLVKVVTPDGEGWGECVAMQEPLYSSEYVDAAQEVMTRWLVPRLCAAGEVTAGQIATLLAPVAGHRMAKAALEMAVLDAVGGYLDSGYVRIKLKIEPGWDVEPVRAVRERFGDDVLLQVDANTAYTLGDAGQLAKLDPFDLLLIEQPLPEDDMRGHAELARRLRTPVCLDESVTSPRAAADAIALGACAIINIKPGRVGGYLAARQIAAIAAANGIPVWCGGMVETGIGRAANIALAAGPEFTLPGDVSASDRFYARDITTPVRLEDGHVRVPGGPGIGVDLDSDVLNDVTTSVVTIRG